jgi:hypothetical protein
VIEVAGALARERQNQLIGSENLGAHNLLRENSVGGNTTEEREHEFAMTIENMIM